MIKRIYNKLPRDYPFSVYTKISKKTYSLPSDKHMYTSNEKKRDFFGNLCMHPKSMIP